VNEFENKTYIITGASKGLGEVLSKDLSKSNINLILLGRDLDNLNKIKSECQNSDKVDVYSIDFLDIDTLDNRINNILSKYDKIDGIVHVAGGGYGFREPLLSYDKFLILLNLNLLSIVKINNILIPKMVKDGMGNIVHIGSIAGREGVASVGYNTAKAALSAYVRSIGNEYAKYNLIISGINPGGFEAPSNAMERLKNNNIEAYEEFVNHRLPRKKMGKAEELIDIIRLLLSEKAGMFCGNMVSCDGGEGKAY
jgi:3-oxoacyl-[acyl-carrier protein] reductase